MNRYIVFTVVWSLIWMPGTVVGLVGYGDTLHVCSLIVLFYRPFKN